jgi:hypothetical protein
VTVIATIHQPSAAVFFNFTHMILLAPGGHQVYAGPLGNRGSTMVRYLESIPGINKLPAKVNPATWMIEEVSRFNKSDRAQQRHQLVPLAGARGDDSPTAETPASPAAQSPVVASPTAVTPIVVAIDSEKNGKSTAVPTLAKAFENSTLKIENESDASASLQPSAASGDNGAASFSTARRPFLFQFGLVLRRGWLDIWRNPTLEVIRFVVFVFIGLFFGLTFFNAGNATDQTSALAKM